MDLDVGAGATSAIKLRCNEKRARSNFAPGPPKKDGMTQVFT
jgi:hypothetical protein